MRSRHRLLTRAALKKRADYTATYGAATVSAPAARFSVLGHFEDLTA